MTARRAPKKENPVQRAAEEVQEVPKPPSGVLVSRIFDEEGNLHTDVQLVGDVRATEVETVLKLGLKIFKARLELE